MAVISLTGQTTLLDARLRPCGPVQARFIVRQFDGAITIVERDLAGVACSRVELLTHEGRERLHAVRHPVVVRPP